MINNPADTAATEAEIARAAERAAEAGQRAAEAPEPAPQPRRPSIERLTILATDDDAVCVDDLCLPPEGRAMADGR